ncbi:PHP domain-containing protein [Microbacterium sp. SORGH_AS_0862]|uniref:PHP domain-containing protein n=1 Tax=Microbacterium sp. SORGH_AS_0862 TaxID=3041789 RepID=UPI0027923BDE|nr:PHP domain-containing protein [Microbacterium sp. SORGH_AS_0862]MDQ1203756.1 putative hydrolase [Microbacterium sp. SORGH_AS_0862]
MDPIDALREIATLLERERASRYRSQAFRAAAEAVAALPAAARSDPEKLRRTKGIGKSSLEVILQAASGAVPDYLAELRERVAPEESSTLFARLRGDLHAHSNWSDGQAPIAAMADAARAMGREYVALTDHSPRLRVANGLTAERLAQQLEELPQYSGDGFTLLSGIEVDILEDGSLDQTPEMLARLDVVVASVHSKLRMASAEMTARMLGAVRDEHTDVLGHCTGRLVEGSRGTRPPSDFDAQRVFAACAERGVAVEINSRPERQDPPDELIAIALDAGCLFAIDSDAHAPGQLSLLDHGAVRAERAGVPEERIVTTWPLDRLRSWLARER